MDNIWHKNYDQGVPQHIDIPDKSLGEIFRDMVRKYPDNTAAVYFGTGITYNDLNSYVESFAAALADMGVKKGSGVVLHLPNTPQFVIGYLATLILGGTVIPCNPLNVERELSHLINDCEAKVIITLNRFYNTIKKIKPETSLKTIITTNIKEYFPGRLKFFYTIVKERKEECRIDIDSEDFWFQDLLKKYSSDLPPVVGCEVDAPACYLYSLGTTGVSKGAVLTHRNLLANAIQNKIWMPDYEEGKEKILAVLPFCNSFGITTCLNLSLLFGGSLILQPRFEIEMLLKTIMKEKPTLFHGVPTIYVAIINAPGLSKYDLSSIKVCISGASPLPVEVQKKFEEVTGGRLVEGYGLTEASPVTHANPVNGLRKEGSVGVPLPETKAKIVDPSNPEKELSIGEEGQLLVSGPQVMQGYYNRPDDTAATLSRGWLLTGDIAKMDEDGYFYIVGRKKDMVIAGGFKIFPKEVEELLFNHEKIREASVAGIPDKYRGETIKAYIVLKEGEKMTEKEVTDYCKEHLAKYKVPTHVEFMEELPRAMTRKAIKRKLIEEETGNDD